MCIALLLLSPLLSLAHADEGPALRVVRGTVEMDPRIARKGAVRIWAAGRTFDLNPDGSFEVQVVLPVAISPFVETRDGRVAFGSGHVFTLNDARRDIIEGVQLESPTRRELGSWKRSIEAASRSTKVVEEYCSAPRETPCPPGLLDAFHADRAAMVQASAR